MKRVSAGKLEVGHLIIVNHVDRPALPTVAVITDKSETGALIVEYVDKAKKFGTLTIPEKYLKQATPLDNFGLSSWLDGDKLFVTKQEASKAVYSDGKPRFWQGNISEQIEVTTKALETIKAFRRLANAGS